MKKIYTIFFAQIFFRISQLALVATAYWYILLECGHIIKAWKTLWQIESTNRAHLLPAYKKSKFIKGQLFWSTYIPPVFSKTFGAMVRRKAQSLLNNEPEGIHTLIVAITKRCPLNCEHCFEKPSLNQKETQTPEMIVRNIRAFSKRGLAQVILSGGEPLSRFETILHILKNVERNVDYWLVSSGYHLTIEKAKLLHQHGLKGIIISLDHVDEKEHDRFRGLNGSWHWAIQALENAQRAGLITGLSLCATQDFISMRNLFRYVTYAKTNKVSFVQILEPKPVGAWMEKNVTLDTEKIRILEYFHKAMMYDPRYHEYPLIDYVEHYQRKYGCVGGKFFQYIDTDGTAFHCPFCKSGGCRLERERVQRLNTPLTY